MNDARLIVNCVTHYESHDSLWVVWLTISCANHFCQFATHYDDVRVTISQATHYEFSNMPFTKNRTTHHEGFTMTMCYSLWVERLTMSCATRTIHSRTHCELWDSLWIVWLTMSHVTHNESYNSLWVVQNHYDNVRLNVMMCDSLWVSWLTVNLVPLTMSLTWLTKSSETHCEGYETHSESCD